MNYKSRDMRHDFVQRGVSIVTRKPRLQRSIVEATFIKEVMTYLKMRKYGGGAIRHAVDKGNSVRERTISGKTIYGILMLSRHQQAKIFCQRIGTDRPYTNTLSIRYLGMVQIANEKTDKRGPPDAQRKRVFLSE